MKNSLYDVSDSGSEYEPSQPNVAVSRKKPATRKKTRGQNVQQSKPEVNSAHVLYESRAAQKASEKNGSRSTKQKAQKQPVGRGRVVKQPFIEDSTQADGKHVPGDAESGKAGGRAAKQKTSISGAQAQKKKVAVTSLPTKEDHDPYEIDADLSPQRPTISKTTQPRKPRGKSQGKQAKATQQNPAHKNVSRSKKNSRLKQQQEREIFEIDDIEDSTTDDARSNGPRKVERFKLVDRMELDDEPAVPTEKQTIQVVKNPTQTTNQNHAVTHHLPKPEQSATKTASTKHKSIDVVPAQSSDSHEDHDTPEMTRAWAPDVADSDALAELDNSGVGVETFAPSDNESRPSIDEVSHPPTESEPRPGMSARPAQSSRNGRGSTDEQSSPSVVPDLELGTPESEEERIVPVKKRLPFQKRGEPQTNSRAPQKETTSHKIVAQSPEIRKRGRAQDEELHTRNSKKAKTSSSAKTTMKSSDEPNTMNQQLAQPDDDSYATQTLEVDTVDQVSHEEPQMVMEILPSKAVTVIEHMPTPAAMRIPETTVTEERAVERHTNGPRSVAAHVKQDAGNFLHDADARNAANSCDSGSSSTSLGSAAILAQHRSSDVVNLSERPKPSQLVPPKAPITETALPSSTPRLILDQGRSMTTRSATTDANVPEGYVCSQSVSSHVRPQAAASHHDALYPQQVDMGIGSRSNHSHFEGGNVLQEVSRTDNSGPIHIHDFAREKLFNPRLDEPSRTDLSSSNHPQEGPRARSVTRQISPRPKKPRVLDHDDVFSPGPINAKQDTSEFIEELKRKAKERDHVEAALRRNEKTQNFSDELLRAPNMHRSDRNREKSNVESTDRHQGQGSAVYQPFHPKIEKFSRQLMGKEIRQTTESRLPNTRSRFRNVEGSLPHNRRGIFREDAGTTPSRRMHNYHSSEEYPEDRESLEAPSTETLSKGNWEAEVEGTAEVDRAAHGLVIMMHEVTMVSLIRNISTHMTNEIIGLD